VPTLSPTLNKLKLGQSRAGHSGRFGVAALCNGQLIALQRARKAARNRLIHPEQPGRPSQLEHDLTAQSQSSVEVCLACTNRAEARRTIDVASWLAKNRMVQEVIGLSAELKFLFAPYGE
jgi:hypothetical protein